ncbi:5-formyltetrahydrofolate cyclo-ligase [Flavobacteriaceae bacterium]|jgi:5-formyltetrahydrofolate cyclo-ligase|nr:5-formyltetrahydrofolate cyclo-ligase [Flavobacteriaceae bacterium]
MKMKHSKTELRELYLKKRQALSEEIHENMSFDIANRCLDLPIWSLDYFHLFLSISAKNEIDTTLILTLLQGRDKQVVLPKVKNNNDLEHILLTDNTRIVKNKWNIPEPAEGIEIDVSLLQVVFVPLLVCDEKGHRVGYGKGYYDRFLGQCKPEIVKIGLSFFDPIPEIDDVYSGDIPLDFCVCPTKTVAF